MRIFSKFKDYYDSALSVFNDPTIVYDRRTRFEQITRPQELPSRIFPDGSDELIIMKSAERLIHIGFCGKWFHCYRKVTSEPWSVKYIYVNDDEIQGLLPWYSRKAPVVDMNADPFWNKDIFVQLNAPILAVSYDASKYLGMKDKYAFNVIVNPNLSALDLGQLINGDPSFTIDDVRMVTKIDPFTAMQELEMFIGNVLTNNTTPTMPVGTDDQIRDSKGFDKWSFRKMKEKK